MTFPNLYDRITISNYTLEEIKEDDPVERYNVNVEIKNKPILDPEFTPLLKFNQAFLAGAKKPISIAVERADKQMATTHT